MIIRDPGRAAFEIVGAAKRHAWVPLIRNLRGPRGTLTNPEANLTEPHSPPSTKTVNKPWSTHGDTKKQVLAITTSLHNKNQRKAPTCMRVCVLKVREHSLPLDINIWKKQKMGSVSGSNAITCGFELLGWLLLLRGLLAQMRSFRIVKY